MSWTWGTDPEEARRSIEKSYAVLTALLTELGQLTHGAEVPALSMGLLRSHRWVCRTIADVWEGCGPPSQELGDRLSRALAECQHALRSWHRLLGRMPSASTWSAGHAPGDLRGPDPDQAAVLLRGVRGQLIQLRALLEVLAKNHNRHLLEKYRAGGQP